jgi:hypothetical protein
MPKGIRVLKDAFPHLPDIIILTTQTTKGTKMTQTTAFAIYFAIVLLIASPFVIDIIKHDRKMKKVRR